MSENALVGEGSQFFIDTGDVSPTVWTEIVDVRSPVIRNGSRPVIDASSLGDPSVVKKVGKRDSGQFTFTTYIQPQQASHAELIQAYNDGQKRDFRWLLTDDPQTEYRFSGYVMAVPFATDNNATWDSNVVVEITGDMVEI